MDDAEKFQLGCSSAGRQCNVCNVQVQGSKIPRPWKSEQYAVKQRFVQEILEEFQVRRCEVQEAFASHLNHRFEDYWDKWQDGFTYCWSDCVLWMNPPFSLLDRVLLKCVLDQVERCILIVPC
jgi:hypothetical protein